MDICPVRTIRGVLTRLHPSSCVVHHVQLSMSLVLEPGLKSEVEVNDIFVQLLNAVDFPWVKVRMNLLELLNPGIPVTSALGDRRKKDRKVLVDLAENQRVCCLSCKKPIYVLHIFLHVSYLPLSVSIGFLVNRNCNGQGKQD